MKQDIMTNGVIAAIPMHMHRGERYMTELKIGSGFEASGPWSLPWSGWSTAQGDMASPCSFPLTGVGKPVGRAALAAEARSKPLADIACTCNWSPAAGLNDAAPANPTATSASNTLYNRTEWITSTNQMGV